MVGCSSDAAGDTLTSITEWLSLLRRALLAFGDAGLAAPRLLAPLAQQTRSSKLTTTATAATAAAAGSEAQERADVARRAGHTQAYQRWARAQPRAASLARAPPLAPL